MTLSQQALDMEALFLGSSFLMADPMGPLLDHDEEALSPSSSFEVKVPASPSLYLSSYASSSSPYKTMSFSPFSSSPPRSPSLTPSSSHLETKAELLSLLGASELLGGGRAGDGKYDLGDMDWSEKMDLSDLDLESLIGSCSSDSPSSPEDLLASLDSHMDLDSFDAAVSSEHISSETYILETPAVAEEEENVLIPDQEILLQSEPSSPQPPSSPSYTLELGSEVDVLDVGKTSPPITAAVISNPSEILQTTSPILLSLPSSAHFVVVLSNKDEPPIINLSLSTSQSSDSESDSGIDSLAGSPTPHPSPPSSPVAGSSRTKPYSKPEPPSPKTPKVKLVSGAPKVVEKKLKKMEQNKTAATRYRQKKRVEQEHLTSELEDMEKRNNELREKTESISREIQYLKDLMEEVRKHHRGKTASVA